MRYKRKHHQKSIIKTKENRRTKLYNDSNILYDWAMIETLLYDEIRFDKNVELEDFLKTPDDSDIGLSFDFDFYVMII